MENNPLGSPDPLQQDKDSEKPIFCLFIDEDTHSHFIEVSPAGIPTEKNPVGFYVTFHSSRLKAENHYIKWLKTQ